MQETASLWKEREVIFSQFWGSSWLERLPVTQEIAGFESRRSRQSPTTTAPLLTSRYWGLQQFGAAYSLRLSAVRYRSF